MTKRQNPRGPGVQPGTAGAGESSGRQSTDSPTVARLLEAARLIDDLDAHERDIRRAREAGRREGWADGYQAGRADAETEMAAIWKRATEQAQRMAALPTFEELQEARRGGRRADYRGGPVEWEQGDSRG